MGGCSSTRSTAAEPQSKAGAKGMVESPAPGESSSKDPNHKFAALPVARAEPSGMTMQTLSKGLAVEVAAYQATAADPVFADVTNTPEVGPRKSTKVEAQVFDSVSSAEVVVELELQRERTRPGLCQDTPLKTSHEGKSGKRNWDQVCFCGGERSISGDYGHIEQRTQNYVTSVPSCPCPSELLRMRHPSVDTVSDIPAVAVEAANVVVSRSCQKSSESMQRLEALVSELFLLHDLNGDGMLDESELIQLNETVTRLHHGQDADLTEVATKYRDLFRRKLDPQGRPVPFPTFRLCIMQMLNDIDQDLPSQEMIVEQWTTEARCARTVDNVKLSAAPARAQGGRRTHCNLWPLPAICEFD
eukprot:TRINITY_DN43205_c0_g1_i1.p1 TRINITY_DN43205_c0_g1~~TRINITY_DN43205_c0_g1_i1.p1  ORF type:complete len:359 (-),score=65.05 TRINITY_DN43205_c0_g1_i1:45-1121(-)